MIRPIPGCRTPARCVARRTRLKEKGIGRRPIDLGSCLACASSLPGRSLTKPTFAPRRLSRQRRKPAAQRRSSLRNRRKNSSLPRAVRAADPVVRVCLSKTSTRYGNWFYLSRPTTVARGVCDLRSKASAPAGPPKDARLATSFVVSVAPRNWQAKYMGFRPCSGPLMSSSFPRMPPPMQGVDWQRACRSVKPIRFWSGRFAAWSRRCREGLL